MGCSQVVRHQVLALTFEGSNPSFPVLIIFLKVFHIYVNLYFGVKFTYSLDSTSAYLQKQKLFLSLKMARKNNSRNLRSSEWSNGGMFCQYVTNKRNHRSWTNRLQISLNTYLFQNKLFITKSVIGGSKKNKKKNTKVQKQARSIVMTSAQNHTVIPLLSKAVTLPRQFTQKKLIRSLPSPLGQGAPRKNKNKKKISKLRFLQGKPTGLGKLKQNKV